MVQSRLLNIAHVLLVDRQAVLRYKRQRSEGGGKTTSPRTLIADGTRFRPELVAKGR